MTVRVRRFGTRPAILGERASQIHWAPILSWYLCYQHWKDGRHSLPWQNLNPGHKGGQNVPKHFTCVVLLTLSAHFLYPTLTIGKNLFPRAGGSVGDGGAFWWHTSCTSQPIARIAGCGWAVLSFWNCYFIPMSIFLFSSSSVIPASVTKLCIGWLSFPKDFGLYQNSSEFPSKIVINFLL